MLKLLDHLEEWLIAFMIGGATLIIFFAVVHRYAAGLAEPNLLVFDVPDLHPADATRGSAS